MGVRSQKHNNSSAFSHHEDLHRVIELYPEAFKHNGKVKPCLIKGTDGGPDENPRFEKNIIMGCKAFKVNINLYTLISSQYLFILKELDLDLYLETTNAPGLSAFNKV